MVAVVTGATRGLGRALAFSLAEQGYDLALTSRNQKDLEHLKSEVTTTFSNQVFIRAADLSVKEDVLSFAQVVMAEFDSIDVLINNIGRYDVGKLTDDKNDLELMLSTNVNSAYYLTKKIVTRMCEQEKGHIFNICSVLSLCPRVDAASYTISKHALKGFNDVLREEMREHQVKVTAIYPGSINTSSWEGMMAPREKFVQPKDICEVVKTCLNVSINANIEEIVIKPLDKKY